jgi:uncharacterized membrane protein YoaK (UPF0700 family)/anti-anti-sigma regulatory factor
MLSASAYSFRQKSRLAISLSWVAGYTNVIAFLMFGGIVVSHATGNVTHFGKAVGEVALGNRAPWREVAFFGFLVGTFLLGAITSAVMTEGARRRGLKSKYILPMAGEAALLIAFGVGIWLHYGQRISAGQDLHFYWMTGAAGFAMGLQNATITRISGAVVRTTHLTGVVTDFGLEGVQYLWWAWDKTRGRALGRAGRVWRVSQRHPSFLRLALLASIFWSFLFGAVLGTIAFVHWPTYALTAPVAFLLWILWLDYRKPIADVRELDLTADPDYRGYGTIRSFLPPELGLYRLIHHRRDSQHHAPDFQAWVERLPRHWRVVILAVSPLTSFDGDAVLNLAAAVQKLRDERRDLVVCGVRPAQYKVLMKSGFTEQLGLENFCPDLDLALARGMNLVAELTTGNGATEIAAMA